jgi:hypothetical protein
MQSLYDIFKYPNGTVKSMEKNLQGDAGRLSFSMTTSDIVRVTYDYYDQLAKLNNWTRGSEGFSTGGEGGWLNIEEKDFGAEISVRLEEGKTLIEITLYSSDSTVTSGRAKLTTASTTTTVGSTSKSGTTPATGYMIDDSDTRIISKSEIVNFTPWQLKVARNEIYARHGREFVHKDLQCYFTAQSWYKIDPNFSESMLSSIENKNVATILSYEQEINSPLLQVDSGC